MTTVSFTLPEVPELNTTTEYYWHVRGINVAGNGTFSDTLSFTTTWASPGAVTLVSPDDVSGNQ